MKNYIYSIFVFIVVLVLATCSVARSDDFSSTHAAAHFGTSYALNTFLYGTMHKGLGLSESDSMIFAGFTTLVLGFAYKDLEVMHGSGTNTIGRAMIWNGAGVIGSNVTIHLFDF